MATEINTEKIFNQLKKQNGEKFAQAIRGDRDHDGNLLIISNILHILEFAGHDENEARKLRPILKEIYLPKEESQYHTDKNPLELLSEVGYDAFVVTTPKQKNSIKQYFRPNEELCTFGDDSRHIDHYIIHAVKRGADKIKPSKHPERQDEYGTSVISIQIPKSGGAISIKNRYNHTVNDPDATFSNNPDNIILGLSNSLKKYFNVDFLTSQQELPDGFRIIGNQFVRFNYEKDNIYYGATFYAEGSKITKLNPNYEIMLDNVILNQRTMEVRSVNQGTKDLTQILNDEISGHQLKIEKDKKTSETIINIIDENKNIKELARTKDGCLTSLHLYKTSEIGDGFLERNNTLRELYAPKLKKMGKMCFSPCRDIRRIYIPELEEMNLNCFSRNYKLKELNAPMLKKMGPGCFTHSEEIENLYIPQLEQMGYGCFSQTEKLKELNAPKLKKIGGGCFGFNAKLEKLYIPELEEIGESVFANVKHLKELVAPKLKKMRHNFTNCAMSLKTLYVPELENIGIDCFNDTKIIQNLYAPKLKIEEHTPKCVLRAIKLATLREGIRNVLGLRHRNTDENNFTNFQKVRELT